MPLLPSQYDATSPYQLLREAEMGRIGFDHRLIRSLATRPAETIPALKRFASEFRSEKMLDLEEQIFDLFLYFRTPEAIPFYLHLMQKEDGAIPDEIIEGLSELGQPAVDPLLARYKELGPEDGADFPFLLAALAVRDPRILEVLLETLDRDVYEGALCLGLYGDDAARPNVEAAIERAESPSERKALEDCLSQLGPPAEHQHDERYDIWGEYPETALPEFDLLPHDECLPFLDCELPDYRREAAFSFCEDSYSAKVRAKLLNHARGDESPEVRAACLQALGESLDDRAVVKLLLEALNDSSRPQLERSGALIGLAPESKRPEVDRAIRAFFENPESREAALVAVARSRDPRYKKLVLDALSSDDLTTHKGGIVAAGALGLSEAAPHLRSVFKDDELRLIALHSYALVAPSRDTAKAIEQLYSDIESLAEGFTLDEADLIGHTLDQRLEKAGLPPVFFPEDDETEDGHDHDHHHGQDHGHSHGPKTIH